MIVDPFRLGWLGLAGVGRLGGPGGQPPGQQRCLIFEQKVEMWGRPVVVEDGETRQFCPLPRQSAKSLDNGAGFARFPYHGAASRFRVASGDCLSIGQIAPVAEVAKVATGSIPEPPCDVGSDGSFRIVVARPEQCNWKRRANEDAGRDGAFPSLGGRRAGARQHEQDRVARSRPVMAVTGTGGEPMSCRSEERASSRQPAVVAGPWSGDQFLRSLPPAGWPIRGVAGREFDLPPRKVVKRSTRP